MVEHDPRTDYYVYFHRDEAGRVFYVGKGTGDRAWSRDRHPVWTKYVTERLNGKYRIEIFRAGLSDQQACELEDALISELGTQLVNWINPRRDFDFKAIERYHQLRDANRRFVTDTRAIEAGDLELAVQRYRHALESMKEYESITRERGLIAELGGGPDWGDPNILDRLTMCLIRLGRAKEAVAEADQYFAKFPTALNLAVGKRIHARIEKHRRKLSMA